jgi:hypothetical protein
MNTFPSKNEGQILGVIDLGDRARLTTNLITPKDGGAPFGSLTHSRLLPSGALIWDPPIALNSARLNALLDALEELDSRLNGDDERKADVNTTAKCSVN